MIHRVPNSGCQRFDNKPNLEKWLECVEKYCNESAIAIFKDMINEQNRNKPTKNASSYIDSETIYFENVFEAQGYAKANPSIKITRSPTGVGFIAKK
jgi:hypothetical protein